MSLQSHTPLSPVLACLAGLTVLVACGGGGGDSSSDAIALPVQPIVLTPSYTHAVSHWHDIAAATVNASGAAATTPEEQRPVFNVDLATVSLAVYDASAAIDGRFKLFGPAPVAPTAGASMDAAVGAAAYGVLRVLFPNRGSQYEAAYASFVDGLPAGEARDKGLALGAEMARNMVTLRANDGRSIVLAAYAPGTAAGKFRGANPANRFYPSIKPFVLERIDQFRPAPPPALDSAVYATDFAEVKAYGATASNSRSAEQLEIARFHTEVPPLFLSRNFGQFARTTSNLADAARLVALIYVANSDAINACFEAKYFYEAWRPQSAIALADTDGNSQTEADPAWTPVVPSPNHPEYPAAHGCTAGSLGEVLRQYYGTSAVSFTFDSKVTGTSRSYASTDAMIEELKLARIYGGMHFRYSSTAGAELGGKTAAFILQNKFGAR